MNENNTVQPTAADWAEYLGDQAAGVAQIADPVERLRLAAMLARLATDPDAPNE